MISSFFSKTKPIHYILVLTVLFLLYFGINFFWVERQEDTNFIVSRFIIVAFLLFSIFIVNFVAKRNKLTGTNSFAILFYVLLTLVFPDTLLDSNATFCSLFLLMATRRIVSLKSLKETTYKLFDASLWIAVASLFYDWALIYFILVFIAIYFYVPKNPRNWVIPIVAAITFVLIGYAILLLTNKSNFINTHYVFEFNITKIDLTAWETNIKLFVYFLIVSFCGIWGFVKLGKTGVGRIITLRLIAISFFLGILLSLLKHDFNTFPIMVSFFPASVFMTNYIESLKKVRTKEIVLILAILVPVGVFIWQTTLL